ncbi:MAG: CRISPR-associated protein Cas5 [Candidatus Roizmanbacteria bacterium]|nr:CRISPR-associated protein Cas5 [Candidatus Roizmanbacteria bacterium]
MNVFSFDIAGDMAFFKKNDTNDMVYISYNFLHKPVILGIIGAILGISGYAKSGENKKEKRHPNYYTKLKDVKIAILPHYEKPLKKVITGFNNSSCLASTKSKPKQGQNWQIREQILVGEPDIRYTVFVLDNNSIQDGLIINLKNMLKNRESEYPLYFGKNEFFAYHENYQEYEAMPLTCAEASVCSLIKTGDENRTIFREVSFEDFDPFEKTSNEGYTIYEHLPYDFDERGFYKKDMFVLTQREIIIEDKTDLYTLVTKSGGEPFNVQFI